MVPGECKGEDDELAITSISWNPLKNGELAFSDSDGQIGTLVNCYDKEPLQNGKKSAKTNKPADDEIENDPDDIYGGSKYNILKNPEVY